MSTEGPITTALVLVLAAILLLWPAFWNGYPLIFADTGTYLSQAIEHYAGWDRPIFYSLFLFPLHMTVTTWPAIGGDVSPKFPPLRSRVLGCRHAHRDGVSLFGRVPFLRPGQFHRGHWAQPGSRLAAGHWRSQHEVVLTQASTKAA